MSTTLNNDVTDAWNDVDQLIRLLRTWGVTYLVGLDVSSQPAHFQLEQISSVAMIQRLAQCDEYPRVRDASISLFLLHPELAESILQALHESTTEVVEQIAVLTLAALYLQRLWSIRLTLALGHLPAFPEQAFAFLWQARHLPPPSCHFGKWGLLALQEVEQIRTGFPFTFIGDWQNQVDHLLLQEEAKHHQVKVPISVASENEDDEQQECDMSMRPNSMGNACPIRRSLWRS